jgi:UDP-N-acetylmuramoyl-tripeptide--D-alanyl-D-alanine ligase
MNVPPRAPGFIKRLEDRVKYWLWSFRKAQARDKQRRFVGRYIAVTGSCGKTTTTKFTGVLLGCYGPSAVGVDNAGIRLLRDIRHLKAPVDYFVQETSGHKPGAIEQSTSVFDVDVAVVTSIGHDHASTFRFPDIDVPDAIAREKGKLVEAVAPGGFACLNFDDPRVRAMATRTAERVIGFGTSPDAEVRAENVRAAWPGRLAFDLVVDNRTYPVATRFVGTMMLTNLLGALAVVHGHGLPLEPAIARLATEEPAHQRMNVLTAPDGKTYIVDARKAPLWSTELLVDDLLRMAIPHLTFVIGDVSDIRSNSGAQYRKLVRRLAERVETLVVAGRAAEYAAKLKDELTNLVFAPTAFDVSKYLDTRPPGVVYLKSNQTLQLWHVLRQVTPVKDRSRASTVEN